MDPRTKSDRHLNDAERTGHPPWRRSTRQRRSGALRQTAFRSRRVGRAAGRAVAVDGERDADEVFARTVLRTGSRAALGAASGGRRGASGGKTSQGEQRGLSSHASRTYEARARARDTRRGGRVDRAEHAVLHHAQTARLVTEREKALQVVARIEEKAATAVSHAQKGLGDARARASEAKRAFGASMAETYAKPSEAAQSFLNDARFSGVDRAAQRMASDPERYGALKAAPTPSRYGLVRSTTTDPARTAAPLAAKYGHAFVETRQGVRKAEAEVRRAGDVHRTVSSELSGVRATASQPGVDEFGPATVRARLERLDKTLRERSARAPGVRITPARLNGPSEKALATRVGSVGHDRGEEGSVSSDRTGRVARQRCSSKCSPPCDLEKRGWLDVDSRTGFRTPNDAVRADRSRPHGPPVNGRILLAKSGGTS